MAKKRIVIVAGTRPEAIKMAPVYRGLHADPRVKVFWLATAQHRTMQDQVLTVFQIRPDIDLDLMRPNQSLSDMTARLVVGVQRAIEDLKSDLILVQGDTTTCFCAALAASYAGIPVGHVEAGLRTYDFRAPWPEEMNRRLVDTMSRWCFAPTKRAVENLRSERIPEENVFLTGNTVVDALLLARQMAHSQRVSIPNLAKDAIDGKRLILVTGHRRENFGRPFEDFCLALRQVAHDHPDVVIVYPVHLNPNVQEPVYRILASEKRIHLIPPVEYLPFVYLMDCSYLIITDSGGIQEEASSLGKPTLITRGTTERQEAIEAGVAKLVGTDRRTIVAEASGLLSNACAYARMSTPKNLFGDGRSAERIITTLFRTL